MIPLKLILCMGTPRNNLDFDVKSSKSGRCDSHFDCPYVKKGQGISSYLAEKEKTCAESIVQTQA